MAAVQSCIVSWLKGDDLDCGMGRGICEWLGWPLPG